MKIVISYYNKRPIHNLIELYSSLIRFHRVTCIVENLGGPPIVNNFLPNANVILNENVGMNIGAWNRGFLESPNEDLYIFLQDECFLKHEHAVDEFRSRILDDPSIGLLGETLNHRWDKGWQELESGPLNRLEVGHYYEGCPAPRVSVYIKSMLRWGIDPGATGLHLRSLVWALPGAVMNSLGGFPIGRDKGECIAAEIGVSCAIRAMGLKVDQVKKNPFWGFGHKEWRIDGSGKL